MPASASDPQVAEYEDFVHKRLHTDLTIAKAVRDSLTVDQEDYRALQLNIQLLVKGCIAGLALVSDVLKPTGTCRAG